MDAPEIQYATTSDGVSIAYFDVGSGTPLVFMPNMPFSHVQLEWQYEPWYERLSECCRLIRYDGRGNGLSERTEEDFSPAAFRRDLEAVVTSADLDRFALFSMIHANQTALAYSGNHPDRIVTLFLWEPYARPEDFFDQPIMPAFASALQHDFDLYSYMAAGQAFGWEEAERMVKWGRHLLPHASTPGAARRMLGAARRESVEDVLPRISSQTVILHRRDSSLMPFAAVRRVAAGIPQARLIVLEGRSFYPFAGDGDAVLRILEEHLASGVGDSPDASARIAGPGNGDVYDLVAGLDVLVLSRYRVVGGYVRFDEVTRSTLQDAKQKITEGFESQGRTRENHLIWGAPGTGKTYFVEQVAASLPPSIRYLELNLAKHDQQRFVADLQDLEDTDHPSLCFVDEIDAKPDEAWPYECLLPYLDAAAQRGAPFVFVLAGSGGESVEELKMLIARRPKGTDLLSRIPNENECEIAPLGVLDRVLVASSQIRQLGREAGRDIRAVEKLGLCYVALSVHLANARQLREFAARAVQRVQAGEDRVKYDDLFGAGDPENKEFWLQAGPAASQLANRFVTLED